MTETLDVNLGANVKKVDIKMVKGKCLHTDEPVEANVPDRTSVRGGS